MAQKKPAAKPAAKPASAQVVKCGHCGSSYHATAVCPNPKKGGKK